MRLGLDGIFDAVLNESVSATERYGDFNSSHEALGVLVEEYDELLEAIRRNNLAAIRREAVQVSSVALRLASACDDPDFRARSVK